MDVEKIMKWFTQIFKDTNDYNEKTIIGFMAFAVMVIIAGVDVFTGIEGKHLEIKEYIYNSFLMLTIGSFGIAGLEKFSPAAKIKAEASVSECENCGTSSGE
jgi:hypothetical protein